MKIISKPFPTPHICTSRLDNGVMRRGWHGADLADDARIVHYRLGDTGKVTLSLD